MSTDFEQRWQKLAGEARKAPPEDPAGLPLGFATRVLARWQMPRAERWEELLFRLGLRAAACAALLLLASAAGLAAMEWQEPDLQPPALDSGLAQIVSLP